MLSHSQPEWLLYDYNSQRAYYLGRFSVFATNRNRRHFNLILTGVYLSFNSEIRQ